MSVLCGALLADACPFLVVLVGRRMSILCGVGRDVARFRLEGNRMIGTDQKHMMMSHAMFFFRSCLNPKTSPIATGGVSRR